VRGHAARRRLEGLDRHRDRASRVRSAHLSVFWCGRDGCAPGRLVLPEDVADRDARIAELERELHDRDLQLREADKLVDAIDVFESAGFRARKKTGRPPSKAAA
jgi:hypothetical protein